MLSKLILENYRCYDKHSIEFKDTSIVVGKNNAGKSTLVEALRLLSIAVSRYSNINYQSPPKWTDLPKRIKGFKPSLSGFELSLENIFHKYAEPPAKISGIFQGAEVVTVYIGENANIFVTVCDINGEYIDRKGVILPGISAISTLPQIGPLNRKEKKLRRDYVKQNLDTDLSSIHFRNQLFHFSEYYQKFVDIAESTWSKLHIRELIDNSDPDNETLSLMVQDNDFVAEVGWMGHGLQMWLQIMWFLARINENEVLILDEPDVYMHPDLQRKLIRYLKGKYRQVIIATHSVEMISQVDPENILIIEKDKNKSNYANKLPAVQKVLNSIGSIHNIQLTKLATTKKLLIVEGKDIDILKRFHSKLFPNSDDTLDSVPRLSIGGWGGWNYAIGSNMLLKNSIDQDIITYCIFDSDFHTDEEISLRKSDARKRFVQLHIWSKKEIENYLLIPQAIYRFIRKKGRRVGNLTYTDVENKLSEICEDLREDTVDTIISEIQQIHKKIDYKAAKRTANNKTLDIKSSVSGKEVLARLSEWANQTYNVSFSSKHIAQEIEINEIAKEMKDVLHIIENCLIISN